MHVLIAQLTPEMESKHVEDCEIYEENRGKFEDGVEEHKEDERDEDIKRLVGLLGHAAEYGSEGAGKGKIEWIDIHPENIKRLFSPHWDRFHEACMELATMKMSEFIVGASRLECALDRANDSFKFDWAYIVGDDGYAATIAEWLRGIMFDVRHTTKRYYIHATYDGNQ